MSTTEHRQAAAHARLGQSQPNAAPLFHHVNLKTTRKAEMIEWYQRVLEMDVVFDHPAGAWLTNDSANHRIALLALPGLRPDPDRRFHDGMHHFAFEFGTFEELNSKYLRLLDERIEPSVCMDHGMTLSYYYADPDFNFVELQCDVFGDWDKSQDWMRNRLAEMEFVVGAAVDPAKVAHAAAGGMGIEAIHAKAYEGGFTPETPPDLGTPPPPPGVPPILRV